MFYAEQEELLLGIVGTGLMGRGIAQIAVLAGIQVRLYDSREGSVNEAVEALIETFTMLVSKGRLTKSDAEISLQRLQPLVTLEGLAGCHCVIEAVVENLDVKKKLFVSLEEIVASDTVLASNTSSLSISAIAADCHHPGRVAGLHFFSPVPLMKLAEVIQGARTDEAVMEALSSLIQRMGHKPVRAKDTPGFIVNHAGRGYLTEALCILGEQVTDVVSVDRILRSAVGFRLGPFELLDLTGLDVSHPVMEAIYDQYYQEPRYRPSQITKQRLAAGLLGRKTGHGFYVYKEGRAQLPDITAAPQPGATPVWISRRDPHLCDWLSQRLNASGIPLDTGVSPAAESVCLVLPLGQDATTAALAEGLDPQRTLALDPLFIERHATLMSTPVTRKEFRDTAWGALAATGVGVSLINDSPGFVTQRVLAMIVNIGCDMAQQKIATPDDIDQAVILGLAYPQGPLALGDWIGPERVLAILEGLNDYYCDPRYRPSPWLIRRTRLGMSLLTQAY